VTHCLLWRPTVCGCLYVFVCGQEEKVEL